MDGFIYCQRIWNSKYLVYAIGVFFIASGIIFNFIAIMKSLAPELIGLGIGLTLIEFVLKRRELIMAEVFEICKEESLHPEAIIRAQDALPDSGHLYDMVEIFIQRSLWLYLGWAHIGNHLAHLH